MNAHDAVLALLAARAEGATICPSEVARALARAPHRETEEGNWRTLMPTVHAAVDRLVEEGQVRLSWKRQALSSRVGPYRISRVQGS